MPQPETPADPSAADPSDTPSSEREAHAGGHKEEQAEQAEQEEHEEQAEQEEDADAGDDFDDFGPPFTPKTFGGAFVWAKGEAFITTVLRIKEGKSVPVATQNRRDMFVMLTGGRAVLEVDDGNEVDRVELLPAGPLKIDLGNRYRLIAMTEVEIFTVYSPT